VLAIRIARRGRWRLLAAIPVSRRFSRCRSGGFVTSYLVQAHISTPILLHLGTPSSTKSFCGPHTRRTHRVPGGHEPGAGSEFRDQHPARKDGGDWVAERREMFITNGGIADFAVLGQSPTTVRASLDFLFLVDTTSPVISRRSR